MAAEKKRSWDAEHPFYVDDSPGYYFKGFAQARNHVMDTVLKAGRRIKDQERFYVNIDRFGKRSIDRPYARIYYIREGNKILFKTVYSSDKPREQILKEI